MLCLQTFPRTLCGSGWISVGNGRAGCCPAGSFILDANSDPFSQATSCGLCPQGSYSTVENAFTRCTLCPVGKANSGTGNTKEGCSSCPRGRALATLDPLVCTICPAAKYQPDAHLDSNVRCISCAAGHYIADDSQDDAQHVSCKLCLAGTEFVSPMSSCQICSSGKYQSANDIAGASCEDCVGLFIEDDRRIREEHDSAGDCKNCPKGFEYIGTDSTKCHICGFSTYQDLNDSVNTKCKTCLKNTYITDHMELADAHLALSSCVKCSTGTFAIAGERACTPCAAGKQEVGSGCIACLAGQFSNIDTDLQCENCPKGFFQSLSGTPYW